MMKMAIKEKRYWTSFADVVNRPLSKVEKEQIAYRKKKSRRQKNESD